MASGFLVYILTVALSSFAVGFGLRNNFYGIVGLIGYFLAIIVIGRRVSYGND